MMFLKFLNKTNLIKLFLLFSFLICWMSVSTSYEDLLIFNKNNELYFYDIANFFRHLLLYICFFIVTILSVIFRKYLFLYKNYLMFFFICYFLFQLPGLVITENSINNISFIIGALTTILTLLLCKHLFSIKERNILIFIPFFILFTVLVVTLIPQIIHSLTEGETLYGLYSDAQIFLKKTSPRSSGLARTALVVLIILNILKIPFSKKKPKLFFLIEIFLLTIIFLFQSRTIIILTIIYLFFIFIFKNKITLKNFIKFFSNYILIPIFIFLIFVTAVTYKNFELRVERIIDLKQIDRFTYNNLSKTIYPMNDYLRAYISDNIKSGRDVSGFDEYLNSKSKKIPIRSVGDFDSGRFDDWINIINKIKSYNIFFGYGAQGDRFLINQTASNSLVYAYASSGLIGAIFFLVFSTIVFLQLIKIIFLNFRINFEKYLTAIIILLLLLRSLLETSYAVFGIDFLVLITFLSLIDDVKIKINDVKLKYNK